MTVCGLFLGGEQNSSTNHQFVESVATCKACRELLAWGVLGSRARFQLAISRLSIRSTMVLFHSPDHPWAKACISSPEACIGWWRSRWPFPVQNCNKKSCYVLVSTTKETQDSSCHLRSFQTSVLPAVASGTTWQFSQWYGLSHIIITILVFYCLDSWSHSPFLPTDLRAVFPKLFMNSQILYFYQQKLLRVLNGSSESWRILKSAGQVFY